MRNQVKEAKPTPPTKSLKLYWHNLTLGSWQSGVQAFFSKPENMGKWPCFECEGKGMVDDESERGCPYGRACWVKCPTCKGGRLGPKEPWANRYRAVLADYRKRKRHWDEAVLARRSALSKLTEEEIKALQWLGF